MNSGWRPGWGGVRNAFRDVGRLGKAVAVAVASTTAIAGDWPEFRGPTGQGLSTAVRVPLRWSAEENVAWKVTIPGEGWSSPILVGDRIYLTSALTNSEDGLSLHVMCLSAGDGKVAWDRDVLTHPAGTLPGIHGKNRQASPTPIARDGRIYAHFGHLGTVALDATGQVLWRQKDLSYVPVHGNGGSPALVGDTLIFSIDAAKDPEVVALGASDGKVRWRTPRNTTAKRTFSFCTPLAIQLDGTTQVILPGSGFVAGYAPADGRELWRVRYGEGYSVVPRPIFAHGLLFLGTGYDRPSVFAVRPAGAKGDATETAIAWQTAKSAPNTPSLLAVGDEVYFVSDGGIATCVEATTGKVHWSERLGGDFSASPVFADGRIYFQNETGTGTVLKPGKQFEVLAKNELGERSLASYAVTDGTLLIRGETHLFRIGKGK